MIKEGDIAPDFTLPSTSGEDFQLSTTMKDKACIIYFYPKDNTMGCTKEACDFRDNFNVFRNLDIPVIGISRDSIESHLKFKEKYELPFELLSDKDGEVCALYDALVPILKIPKRKTLVLDKEHRIKLIFQDFFGSGNHVKKVLEEVQKENVEETNKL